MSEENTNVIIVNGKRYVHGRVALRPEECKTPEKCRLCAAPAAGLSCALFGYQCLLEGPVYWVAQPKLDIPREKVSGIPVQERATCPKCRKRFRASTAKAVRKGAEVESWCPWCAHEESVECGKCGERTSIADSESVAGAVWCQPCVDRHTVSCRHCHAKIPKGQEKLVSVSGEIQEWCPACASSGAAACPTCGGLFPLNDMASVDGVPACRTCADAAPSCGVCGTRSLHLRDDGCGNRVCPACLEKAARAAVHDYHGFPGRNRLKLWKTGDDAAEEDRLLYLGFELEAGGADQGRRDGAAIKLHDLDRYGKRYHMERDGTIPDYGFELISSPHTLNAHARYSWEAVLAVMRDAGMRSHDLGGRCGLHVHVSRAFLTQEDCMRLDMFVLKNRRFWERLARRSSTDWSKFYDKGIADYGKSGDRHSAINFRNQNTVEFRMFRGTLKCGTLRATLEVVDGLCRWIKTRTADELLLNSGETDKFAAWLAGFPQYALAAAYIEERKAVEDPDRSSASAGD